MAEALKTTEEKFGQLANDFLEKVKEQAAEIKAVKATLPNTEQFQKMQDSLDKLETQIKTARLQQTSAEQAKILREQTSEEKKEAFHTYLRKGDRNMSDVELKLLTIADNTTGGFLAYPEFVQEIIKGVVLISQIRGLARVRTTSNRSVRVPKRTATASASWLNAVGVNPEIGPKSETTNPAYGQEEIPNHELYAMADISNQDLEDSAFDLNAELMMEFTEQIAKAEGSGFVSGTGAGMPEGLLTNTAIASDNSGNATTLTYDGLVAHAYALKTAYASEATFLMNRQTIGVLRRMVDLQGRPIWLPSAVSGLAGGNPATIIDIPYAETPDMPDVGANTYPILIGAFKRGYWIVDRLAVEIQRDPYTQNTKGVTRFIARKRVGGQVVLVEAFRKLKVHV